MERQQALHRKVIKKNMNLVLKVPYKGKPMMVGKVFRLGDEDIFYHEHTSSQHFHSIPSLPIDWCVLSFLEQHDVTRVDYFDKDENILRTTTLQKFSQKGIRLTLDTRDRVYLPLSEWTRIDKDYNPPFVTLEMTLDG